MTNDILGVIAIAIGGLAMLLERFLAWKRGQPPRLWLRAIGMLLVMGGAALSNSYYAGGKR